MNAEVSLDGNLAWLQDEMRANRARLPQQLINARRWMLWESVPNPDPKKKDIKEPYYVDGRKRQGTLDSPEDTARLATFDEAIDALWQGDRDYEGLAFALGPDGTGHYWQGFDADNVPAEHVDRWIAEHAHLGYVEVSPSGRGAHIIGYGQQFRTLGPNGTDVEAYAGGRYFTFTGDRGRGVPACIAAFVNGPVAERHGAARPTASAAGETVSVDPKTVSELRSALLHMRTDEYDIWYRMGLALKELGDVGRGLWMEWSATSTKFDVQEASRKWEQLGTPRDTGYRAVFAEAQRQGWVNPASNAAQPAAAPAEGSYSFARGRGGEAIVETQYLIDPWLPRATVIGFYGRGEAGKTSFVAQMVGAASRQVSTLWISSEERKDHILKRHEKCLGRMDALAVLETVPTKIDEKTKKPVATSFNIFEHMEGAMQAYQRDPATPTDRPLGVVVLDAVVALVTWEKGTNANDDGAVKKLIAHLFALAEKYGVTFIMLGHLNKRTGHDHIADAVTGAAAWTNSVRLAFMLQKNVESDDYEGFIRTAKTNTGTHFGITYKTVARHVLKVRDDGKPDVLCGIDLVGDVVWGEHALREMMATDDESERWLNKREKKAQTVHMLVEIVLNTLRSISTTNRKSVELSLPPGEKVSRRHWAEADKILASRGVQIVNLERGQFCYSLVQQPK